MQTRYFILFLVAVAVSTVQAFPAFGADIADMRLAKRTSIEDNFKSLDKETWKCEYTCPVIESGKARFRLHSHVPPDEKGSWSKIRYKPRRFTSGRFTVEFSLSSRPPQKVWWGVALWDDGSASNGSKFNEINFGYVTGQSFTDTQLLFESARNGNVRSIRVDTGVDLYNGESHTATLEYNHRRVAFYLNGRLLRTITDKEVIPTDPMDLVLGPRLVTGSKPLAKGFTQTISRVEISS